MSNTQYRNDPKTAVRIFRPILQELHVRDLSNKRPVFLAAFDHLAFLSLDYCSIQFAVGKIDASGIFLIKYTKQGLLRAYIILNENLYVDNNNGGIKEFRKIAAVHEFVHFIAILFVATVTKTVSLRSTLLTRLHNKVQKFWGPNSLQLYYALTGKETIPEYTHPELTDAHFRIGYEGPTPDYEVLFLHFLFSRELFETYFGEDIQNQFKQLYADPTTRNDAIKLLLQTLSTAASAKDVPINTARNQLFEWVHVYMR